MEAVGSIDPAIDAEVISLAARFFQNVGVASDLRLNSIGCPNCRPGYRQALTEYIADTAGDLCANCAHRYETNPMRMFDCKDPGCKAVLAGAPKMVDYLDEDCASHFKNVQDYLIKLNIDFTLDPTLVRGFDYYTKTAFEFVSGELGAQNAVGGGGRYDNLVEEIGGPSTPAMGFGIGLERLMMTLEALGVEPPVHKWIDVFVATLGDQAHEAGVKLVADLRAKGVSADMDYTGRSLKAQMKVADKLGAKYAVILGEDEVKSGVATVRDLTTSEQKSVPMEALASRITDGQIADSG